MIDPRAGSIALSRSFQIEAPAPFEQSVHGAGHEAADEAVARRAPDDENRDLLGPYEIENGSGHVLRFASHDGRAERDGQLNVLAQLPMLF